ncbi:MAG: Holliday junction branch migration DNA helicase RuvB [Christensenellaceae bacterium]|jgi:Holliday junction DNA helicase RuvB|nr:Holliday junction branch migration DNA helicase RuvB [Christensenellaceae bacterium]
MQTNDSNERILNPEPITTDENDNSLRPRVLRDYIGQDKVKSNLSVFMHSAKKRGTALDHVLLYGPPGLGKTTLSRIIANEMCVDIQITSGPAIERAGDLAAILTSLQDNSVLFIDEIHRLNRAVEEILYPAMEDFALDMVLGKGLMARTVRVPLKNFTLVGATTRAGMLSAPLRDRFGVICRLDMYNPDDLALIITRSARILCINISAEACLEIASRSRGTPRIANRLLKRLRDFAEYYNSDSITTEIAKDGLAKLEVDALGLDRVDITILNTIIEKFDGGPVGLDTLAAASGEENNTIEDVYEPYLLQLGFITRTPRGRICLRRAYEHLGLKYTPSAESMLNSETNEVGTK